MEDSVGLAPGGTKSEPSQTFLSDRNDSPAACCEIEPTAESRFQRYAFPPDAHRVEEVMSENEPPSHRTVGRKCHKYPSKQIGAWGINMQTRSEE